MNATPRNPDVATKSELDAIAEDVDALQHPASYPGVITRDGGQISSITTGGRTLTITRVGGRIASVTDGVKAWTYLRDETGRLLGWTVEDAD